MEMKGIRKRKMILRSPIRTLLSLWGLVMFIVNGKDFEFLKPVRNPLTLLKF